MTHIIVFSIVLLVYALGLVMIIDQTRKDLIEGHDVTLIYLLFLIVAFIFSPFCIWFLISEYPNWYKKLNFVIIKSKK